MSESEIVPVEDLPAYLAQHGLRVVRGGWRWGEKRPYVIVAAAPAALPDAQPPAEPERKDTNQ